MKQSYNPSDRWERALILFVLFTCCVLAACSRESSSVERLPSDWTAKLDVMIEIDDQTEDAKVVLEAVPGWYVNRLYGGISVSIEDPARSDEGGLSYGHEDVSFEGLRDHDKARRAGFGIAVGVMDGKKELGGKYRAVVCKEDACSPPFSGSFNLPLKD